MQPESVNEDVVQEKQVNPLNQVTPLSKYLAMALFIILPFVGGYIGYTYAPEKVAEVEREVIREVIVKDSVGINGAAEMTSGKESDLNQSLSGWTRYEDDGLDLSFMHPKHWECQTKRTHMNHPDWLQTICIDTQNKPINPVLALDTPYIKLDDSDSLKSIETVQITLGGRNIIKRHTQGVRAEMYQIWEYIYENDEEQNSFRAFFPFRTDEGTSAKKVEEVSMTVVDSIEY